MRTAFKLRPLHWALGGLSIVAALGVAIGRNALVNAGNDAPSGSDLALLSSDPLSSAEALSSSATPAELGEIASKKTLADAIADAKPHMEDTEDRLDEGSAMLTVWAAQNLTWRALDALPETSPALFRKDPDFERGRRLCMTGRIVEIRAETALDRRLVTDHPSPLVAAPSAQPPSEPTLDEANALDADVQAEAAAPDVSGESWRIPDGGKVFFAVLTTAPLKKNDTTEETPVQKDEPPPLIVSAILVGSTGTLVDGDTARVCGVLTGVNETSDDNGATQLWHRVVGMADLPENHAALARMRKP